LRIFDSEVRHVVCQRGVLEYRLIRKDVKNINLRIKSDGQILVSAGQDVPVKYVDDFVCRKQEYICRNRDKRMAQEDKPAAAKRYVSGEGVDILGKSLRLKVMEGDKEEVWTDGVFVFLRVKEKADWERKEKLLDEWMKKIQQKTFGEISEEVYQRFKKYDIQYPKLKIRDMSSRWGTCQPQKGIITLNSKLIEAPKYCIEYVVLHEYVHFICPDHSEKFYRFMTMMMPDWEERKKELENLYQGISFLQYR
jgi:predicted metal-dependent hydrolase